MNSLDKTSPQKKQRINNRFCEVSFNERYAEFKSMIIVDKNTGCHNWTGPKVSRRYGGFWINKKNLLCHRIIWMAERGDIPDGMSVCHTCDNGFCCNLDHLFIGTHSDNMKDKVSKDRANMPRGVDCYLAKLNPADIQDIRVLRKKGETYSSIGNKFNVSPSTICGICSGRTWRHVS